MSVRRKITIVAEFPDTAAADRAHVLVEQMFPFDQVVSSDPGEDRHGHHAECVAFDLGRPHSGACCTCPPGRRSASCPRHPAWLQVKS